MKLRTGIYLVGSGDFGVGLTHPLDCNVYLVTDGKDAILVDSGCGLCPELILSRIEEDGIDVGSISHLLLTHAHADHSGGAAWWRERLGLCVVAPKDEAKIIATADAVALGLDSDDGYYPAGYKMAPCPIDRTVSAGETLRISGFTLRVFDGAGHSQAGVCYYLENDGGSLFCGDLLAYDGFISLQNIPGADVARYSQSVSALKELKIEGFFPGHMLFSLTNGERHVRKAAEIFSQQKLPPNLV